MILLINGYKYAVAPTVYNINAADLHFNGLDVDYTTHRTFSALAQLKFSTSATQATVSIFNSMGVSKSITVLVDGVFKETRTATTDNAAYNEVFSFTAGAKVVTFILGTTDRTNDTGNIKTTTIRSVTWNGAATVVPWTKKSKSYVLITDSIATGYALAEPGRYAWPALFRNSKTDFDFTLLGYGGKRAYTAFNDSGARTAVIAQLSSLFTGVYEKRVYIELGANDYVTSTATAAQVATAISNFLNDLIAAFPDVQVVIQSPTTDTGESFALEDYRTAQAALVTGRERWVTYINGPSMVSPSGNYLDTVHLNNTGHSIVHTYLGTRIFSYPAVLTNLLKGDSSFDSADWDKPFYNTITANTIVAPDGTTTAEVLVPNTTSTNHYVEAHRSTNGLLGVLTAGSTFTLSVYAKPSGYKRLNFFFQRRDNTYAEVIFDLAAAGTIIESSGTPTSSGIKAEKDGWYRCWMVVNVGTGSPADITAGFKVLDNVATLSSINFAGDGTSGMALWGAQINAGSVANSFRPYTTPATTIPATTIPGTTISGTTAPVTTSGPATDSDATAYISATGLTGSTAQQAVHDLFAALKTAGVWTKIVAGYMFVGGTYDLHKWNFKNPTNSNGAYRLTSYGTVTHDANGVQFNSDGFLNTYVRTDSNPVQNNVHVAIYSRTNTAKNNTNDIGNEETNGSMWIKVNLRNAAGNMEINMNNNIGSPASVANANSQGFYVSSRAASNQIYNYKNGAAIGTNPVSQTSGGTSDQSVYIGGSASRSFYSNRQYAFASIGAALSDAEVAAYYTAVQAFQTALGRQV